MAKPSQPDQEIPPLWQYVSIAEYQLPTTPVEHTVKQEFSSIWRQFWPKPKPAPAAPLKTKDELRTMSTAQIEWIAPAPNWQPMAAALDDALAEWLDNQQPPQVRVFVIAPPHGGHSDILTTWAKNHDWRIVSPPSPEQILARDLSWLDEQLRDPSPWVLPSLERCYLRHARGFELVRHLLDQSSLLGHSIIGCDSWAWAFLRKVWRGPEPPALALQGLDQQGLARWFQGFITDRFVFRQADSGAYVLPPPADIAEDSSSSIKISDFLRILAAHSRGIPGIAHAIWRTSLRTTPDETFSDTAANEDHTNHRTTIWVAPWNQIKQPTATAELLRKHAFLLHTLLLHNSLTHTTLALLLPLAASSPEAALACLEEAGLVIRHAEEWRISPAGYPIVRQFLNDDGYLIDVF